VEQFFENFNERKNEIRERIKVFMAASDAEVDKIMAGVTDELLLANEIGYVNGNWEKVSNHRNARKDELANMRKSLDDLKTFQEKGSGGYLHNMRENLATIAFFLAPEVDQLIVKWVDTEERKYKDEHTSND
jgi:hypothetical protein